MQGKTIVTTGHLHSMTSTYKNIDLEQHEAVITGSAGLLITKCAYTQLKNCLKITQQSVS